MNITVKQCKGRAEIDDVQLVVELNSATTIAVRAGTFYVGGILYSLEEDQLFTITPSAIIRQWVDGWLVVDDETGNVFLLVDEWEYGEGDERFNFSLSSYTALHYLYRFELPIDETDLNNASIDVEHRVPPLPDSEPEG